MEYSPEGAIPYLARVDAGTIESIRDAGCRSGVVGRSRAALRGVLGRRGDRDAPRGVRTRSTGSRIARSTLIARTRPGWHAHDRIRHPAADGGLVPRRGHGQRLAPDRRGRRTRGGPALPPRPDRQLVDQDPTSSSCSISGPSSRQPGAVYADITWVGFTGRPGARRAGRRVCRDRRVPATRRSKRPSMPPPRGRRPSRLAGRPRRPHRAAGSRVWRPDPAPDRAQPG